MLNLETIPQSGDYTSLVDWALAIKRWANESPKPLDDGQEGKGLRWVKASERLPPLNKKVIIRDNDGTVYSDQTKIGWDKKVTDYEWLDETPALPVADGEGEKVGLPKFLVIKDDSGTFEIWGKNRYETYVKKATDYGATPAVKIIAGFNGNEDFLFPWPSAVTGGVKEKAIGFSMWLQSLNKSGYPKNENGTMVDIWQLYNYWNSKVDKKPYYLHARFDDANPLQPNHPSEGQPAQGKE